MNTALLPRLNTLRARLFAGILLGLAAIAAAHHGNPDAPAPSPWSNGSSSPGMPAPSKPLGPGY